MEKPPQIRKGPKKVVDCKLDEDGKQFYKVKWESTWEPAENLRTCQHLVDEFWSFLFNAKKAGDTGRENFSDQLSPTPVPSVGQQVALQRLSHQEKEGIQEMVNRPTSLSPSEAVFSSPSFELDMNMEMIKQEGYVLVHQLPQVESGNQLDPVESVPGFHEGNFQKL